MKQKHKKKPLEQRQIALERMNQLFQNANNQVDLSKNDKSEYHLKLAQRYIDIAGKISTKYKVKLPRELKRRICNHCKTFMIPGINCRVRLRNMMVVTYCQSCKKFSKVPYIKEIKERRRAQKASKNKTTE